MAIGEGIVNGEKGFLFPLAGFVVFDIACGNLIILRFAQIVQQRAHRKAFLVVNAFFKIPCPQNLIDVYAVHDQSGVTGAVEPCAGRRSEEVGGADPLQKLICTGPGNLCLENLLKLFSGVLQNVITGSETVTENLKVVLQIQDIGMLFLLGGAVILVALCCSILPILRANPKDILAKMEG